MQDAINLAGGFAANVDQSRVSAELNRAQTLTDGQKILIPIIEQAQTATNSTASSSSQTTGKVNLNTADATALDTLPGIGPAYAKRILDYRTSHGGFKSIEELTQISGIGDKTMEKLRDLVSL